MAWGVWAPVPIATEFKPVASAIVPIARAISPALAFTPKATAPWPASVPWYLSYLLPSIELVPLKSRSSPLPVKEENIWFNFLLTVTVEPTWFPFLSKIFFS